jgi:hypothetical protein
MAKNWKRAYETQSASIVILERRVQDVERAFDGEQEMSKGLREALRVHSRLLKLSVNAMRAAAETLAANNKPSAAATLIAQADFIQFER